MLVRVNASITSVEVDTSPAVSSGQKTMWLELLQVAVKGNTIIFDLSWI